jgi:hypothetical protein
VEASPLVEFPSEEVEVSEKYKAERRRMEERLQLYQLTERPVKGDGNWCAFLVNTLYV